MCQNRILAETGYQNQTSFFFFFLTFVSKGTEESTKSFTVCYEITCTEAQAGKINKIKLSSMNRMND